MQDTEELRKDSVRRSCLGKVMDFMSLGEDCDFYTLNILNESTNGLGAEGQHERTPSVGNELDWCGLKRYQIRWVKELDQKSFKLGLLKV